jgi:hypothetical protein
MNGVFRRRRAGRHAARKTICRDTLEENSFPYFLGNMQ